MTADEAKQALKDGKHVRPKSWTEGYSIAEVTIIMSSDGEVYTERVFDKFKDDEWEIVE